jgi:hypothetical protein
MQLIILLGLMLSITGMGVNEVQAATCRWEGDNGPDWATPGNWSCGDVPGSGDDVIIPNLDVDPTINALTTGVEVNSITIESNAVLTVNATQNSLTIFTSSSFTNDGDIIINGQNPGARGLSINSPAFSNAGNVIINSGYLKLDRGGTHSGSFVGQPGTVLNLNNLLLTQILTFSAESHVNVPIVMVNGEAGNMVNLNGEFAPSLVSPETSEMQISSAATVNLDTNNILMPTEVTILGTLNVLALSAVDIPTLKIIGGSFSNSNTINITSSFDFLSANLSGSGDITISSTATSAKIRGGIISGKTLRNDTIANWTTGNLTLSNSAVFENNDTFNANATSTMTGTAPADFINNGTFIKNTTGTTTTMNIPFTNNGDIEITAGELIFQQGIQNGTPVVFDLGDGTLDPGETLTLEEGDSLVGSGTLSANLVNDGTVSPGASPGIITVNGSYTQQANGVLEIELGGTTAGTGYDQLEVNGAASLDGVLNVSLLDGFKPEAGNEFLILPYTSRSGEFTSPNLPEEYNWDLEYGISGLTLIRLPGGSISGTVNCNSSHTVFVDLYVDEASPPPEVSTQINCNESYSFDDLPDGTYFVGAWIDLDESGDGPPDEGEPTAWYGEPSEVTIIDGETQENIDITIEGGGYHIFLPLIIR